MNIYRGDNESTPSQRPSQRSDVHSLVVAKIAFLTGMFEKLVAEAGLRRERIEQMLAEMNEEREQRAATQDVATESQRRAA